MTHLLLLFFATFSAAFMATVPPGLLNLNAAKISVEKSEINGIIFSLGVSTMVLIQATIGVFISKFLDQNPAVVAILLKVAIGVFAALAIYFFTAANRSKKKKIKVINLKKRKSYYKGLFLASINLLTIPYYSALNIMWNASGWIKFQAWDIVVFVLAAGLGTFAVLYLYVFYFKKLERKTTKFGKNANYILGFLMIVLLIITVIRVLNHS